MIKKVSTASVSGDFQLAKKQDLITCGMIGHHYIHQSIYDIKWSTDCSIFFFITMKSFWILMRFNLKYNSVYFFFFI